MIRKTYTSTAVKQRYNSRVYDRLSLVVPKGAAQEIARAAQARGLSMAAYVRTLVIKDTTPDETPTLRGGNPPPPRTNNS